MGIGDFLKNLFGGAGPDPGPVIFELVESDWAALSIFATEPSMVTAADTAFVVTWQDADQASTVAAKSASRSLTLGLSPGSGRKKVRVVLQGNRLYRFKPAPRVTIRIAGKPYQVDVGRADPGFEFAKTIRLAEDASKLEIVVEVVVPRPALDGANPEIQIEALDLNGRQEMI